MPEIGTSGSMSGDGKRSAAAWPKLPRPSSTLPNLPIRNVRFHGESWRVSGRATETAKATFMDPQRT
jgi:hypothetical protein